MAFAPIQIGLKAPMDLFEGSFIFAYPYQFQFLGCRSRGKSSPFHKKTPIIKILIKIFGLNELIKINNNGNNILWVIIDLWPSDF